MSLVVLPAHFNGEHIQLDEPFELAPNTKLIITVLPESADDPHHEEWLCLSEQRLYEAYSEDEPDYSPDLLKEVNPDYERG